MRDQQTTDSLVLGSYDAFGFDVDHCLAKYNIPKLFNQIHFSLTRYLVEEKGYDESLKAPLDADFLMRGIVLDVRKGNFLKLSEDGTILGASHGTKLLSMEDVKQAYGEQRHWPLFETLIGDVNNIGEKFRIFENFFDMPLMMASARLIDLADATAASDAVDAAASDAVDAAASDASNTPDGETRDAEEARRAGEASYTRAYTHLMEAALEAYDPKHFALERGNFFPQFKSRPQDFLQPCSADVKRWLKRLRQDGRVVFIATSSFNDFAIITLQFILGSDWQDYFDFVFTFARKPGFFKHQRKFLKVVDGKEGEAVGEIAAGKIYSQGNSEAFMEHLRKATGKAEPKVVFFGDSLRSDVFPSKVFGRWDTVLVLEEMICEQHAFKPEAVVEPEGKKIKLAEPSDLEKKYLTSNMWGSFFTDCHAPNIPTDEAGVYYMNTLWGFIVRKYADIAIPQLEYIADLELSHEFKVFNHEAPLEWGFYPGLPTALQRTKSK